MRARVIVLIAAILLVAGFASLNWNEVTRSESLSFGLVVSDAPLGLILLTLLGIALMAFVLLAAMHRTQTLVETRHHYKSLEAQRDLADKAEASRFTELRHHFDSQLKDLRQRDTIAATEFEKAMVTAQRELRTNLEQMNRMMMGRIAELEQRLDMRLQRLVDLPVHAPVDMLRESELEREERLRRVEPPAQVKHPL